MSARIKVAILIIVSGFIALIQLSCGTFQIIIKDANLPSPTPQKGLLSPTPSSSIVKLIPDNNSIAPLPTTTPTTPWFSPQISFYLEPDPKKSQRIFPEGTQQIFAIWDYSNMDPKSRIRREWYRGTELILVQEDLWDYTRYGPTGTISDITLHNFETGLEKGFYSLRLFINGQEQTFNSLKDQASFRIVDVSLPQPLRSPDGSQIAFVSDPRSLIVQIQNNAQKNVFTGQEIAGFAWFPDNQNIIVSNRDRTKQELNGNPEGIRDELWIIDTSSGLRIRIATPEENFHMPLVSPDGHYVAAISGTGRFNTCESDLSIILIELDTSLTRIAVHDLAQFSGFPDMKYTPVPVNSPAVPLPGTWIDASRIHVSLKFPCSSGEEDGVYVFDLESWQVERFRQ
jgi:hypothetical protein